MRAFLPFFVSVHHCRAAGLAAAVLLAGCATREPPAAPEAASASMATSPLPTSPSAPMAKSPAQPLPALPRAGSGRGGYYQDDGPGDVPPEGLLDIPDAEPKIEAYSTRGNKPYVVFGKTYTPFTDERPFRQSGVGSWYGRKFHGQKTSSGELYDMYQMTAAHPTLPIPSYVRVTNQQNGRQVIVRVNDRGPFLHNRIIDLSYTAALKLGYLEKGSGMLLVERLLPDDIQQMAQERALRLAAGPAMPGQSAAPTALAQVTEATAVAVVAPSVQEALLATDRLPASAPSSAISGMPPAIPAEASSNTVPAAAAAKGIYLQFGAYAQEANALAARGKLLQELAGVVPSLNAVMVNGLHRLHAGPYADRSAASDAARMVQQRSTLRPVIVER